MKGDFWPVVNAGMCQNIAWNVFDVRLRLMNYDGVTYYLVKTPVFADFLVKNTAP